MPDPAAHLPRLSPTTDPQRVHSIDALRGVAVLGILTMNIVSFALPGDAYITPMNAAVNAYAGDFTGANAAAWWITYLLCDQKFMSIFAMLFGAGLVMLDSRARAGFADVYYRRLLWLFILGMLHAYLLWNGDILVAYAICATALYPLRRLRPAWLIAIGLVVMLAAIPIDVLLGVAMKLHGGRSETSPEDVHAGVDAMRGSYARVLKENAVTTFFLQTFIFATWTLWRSLGLMLIGMGLAKLGVFSNARPRRFYLALAALGYAVGLPLIVVGAIRSIAHRFDMTWAFLTDWHFNYVGAFLVALAHASVVMLLLKPRDEAPVSAPGPIAGRLAAVGRMPLTNYLMQTILCTTIFFGWGFARFAHYERAQVYLVVLLIWALELLWSPWWLSRFRFGPAEWLWKSLTYWRAQPMRRDRSPQVPAQETHS